jgi:hypothetical protein
MRLLIACLANSIIACLAQCQVYIISTFAGGGLPVNVSATSAALAQVGGITVDSAGNVFFTSVNFGGDVVLRLDRQSSLLTQVAGNGSGGFSGDNGPATNAQLRGASALAVDSLGNLYIADAGNNRIRKVSGGVITTVAGGGTEFGDGGPATSAQLFLPRGVAVDGAGNLYIAEYARIRKVSNGIITTVAGNGMSGFSGDGGSATSASIAAISVAVDFAGDIYIGGDYPDNRVRKISNGVIVTVAGDGTSGFSGDGGPAAVCSVERTHMRRCRFCCQPLHCRHRQSSDPPGLPTALSLQLLVIMIQTMDPH